MSGVSGSREAPKTGKNTLALRISLQLNTCYKNTQTPICRQAGTLTPFRWNCHKTFQAHSSHHPTTHGYSTNLPLTSSTIKNPTINKYSTCHWSCENPSDRMSSLTKDNQCNNPRTGGAAVRGESLLMLFLKVSHGLGRERGFWKRGHHYWYIGRQQARRKRPQQSAYWTGPKHICLIQRR